jgi:O-antigen/teichoic acid export membrane protein
MTRRVVASLLWQASASLVGQTISWFSTRLVIRLLSPDDFGLMAMAGISIGFIMLMWFGYTNLDVTIAGRALGGALVGVYSVALSLASIPLDKMMSIATQVSFSAFSRSQTDPGAVRHGVLRAMESVSLLAFPTSSAWPRCP